MLETSQPKRPENVVCLGLTVGPRASEDQQRERLKTFPSLLGRPGDYGGVAAPDPIPNSAVKRPSADGTSS